MSEQEHLPVWHAIVGDDWEPVLFGELTGRTDEVLKAEGWVENCDGGGFIFHAGSLPRRRRKTQMFCVVMKDAHGRNTHVGSVHAGQRFEVGDNGVLVEVEADRSQKDVDRAFSHWLYPHAEYPSNKREPNGNEQNSDR